MDYEKTLELIRTGLGAGIQLRGVTDGECLISLPFWDNYGDPIQLSVSTDDANASIDDGGSVAGLFFSLGQHTQDTPAYQLLRNLEQAHGFDVDFNEGVLRVSMPAQALYEGFAEFTKVILALHTVTPHIRIPPRRMKSLGGKRLTSRIRDEYEARGIIELVEQNPAVNGITIPYWHADFHWSVAIEDSPIDVFVVATDLNVREPLQKAQRITAFSLDTQPLYPDGGIRVLMDVNGGNPQAADAANYLRHHSTALRYRVFDFGSEPERSEFFDTAADEILGPGGASWRNLLAHKQIAMPAIEEASRSPRRLQAALEADNHNGSHTPGVNTG